MKHPLPCCCAMLALLGSPCGLRPHAPDAKVLRCRTRRSRRLKKSRPGDAPGDRPRQSNLPSLRVALTVAPQFASKYGCQER